MKKWVPILVILLMLATPAMAFADGPPWNIDITKAELYADSYKFVVKASGPDIKFWFVDFDWAVDLLGVVPSEGIIIYEYVDGFGTPNIEVTFSGFWPKKLAPETLVEGDAWLYGYWCWIHHVFARSEWYQWFIQAYEMYGRRVNFALGPNDGVIQPSPPPVWGSCSGECSNYDGNFPFATFIPGVEYNLDYWYPGVEPYTAGVFRTLKKGANIPLTLWLRENPTDGKMYYCNVALEDGRDFVMTSGMDCK